MTTPYNSQNTVTQYRSYGLSQDDFRKRIHEQYNDVLIDHEALANNQPGMLSDTWNAMMHGASSELAGLSRFLGFDGLTNYFQEASQGRLDNMSESGRAAFENELQFDLDESPLSHWWLNTASAIGQFGTSIVGGGVVGAGVRKGVVSAAARAGAGKKVTTAAGTGGLMAGHASVGGSAATGQTVLEAEAAYDQLSEEERLSSPAFRQKMEMLREMDPSLEGEELFGLADAAIREQIARDIKTDPRILFANYGLSAVVDPIIGGTIGRTAGSRVLNQLTRSEGAGTAARLGGAAVRTGAHFGKGATLGAPTEVIQDMELQRGVARSLEGIDPNADPNKIDTNRALVSGVLGGVAQGSIAAVTSRSPVDTSNIRDPDADAIRSSNPELAEQLDSMMQDKARHEAEVGDAVSNIQRETDEVAPDPRTRVSDSQVAAAVERMRALDENNNTVYVNQFGQRLNRDEAESLARAELEKGDDVGIERPAALRQAEQVGPPRPAREPVETEQKEDLEQPAITRSLQASNGEQTNGGETQERQANSSELPGRAQPEFTTAIPSDQRSRVPGDPYSAPAYTRVRQESVADSQLEADIRLLNDDLARRPREGQILPGEEIMYSTSERIRSDIDGEVNRRALPDRSGIPMPDRRNEQLIRERMEQQPRAIEKSSTIFASGETRPSIPDGVTVKQNGQPFASERSALASLRARQAKERGNSIEAVEVPGGWGWQAAAAPPTPLTQAPTSKAPSQEGVSVSATEETVGTEQSTPTEIASPRGKPSNQIDDFGEKIGGARKDVWSGFKDAIETTDTRTQPLSKSFPQPDYVKLKEAGTDPQAMAAVAALRQSIPNKPRSRGVARWAENADAVRRLAAQLIDGSVKPERLLDYARAQPALRRIANALPVIAEADPSVMKQAAEFSISESSGLYVDGKPFGTGFIIERNGRGDWNSISKTLEEAQGKLRTKIDALKTQPANEKTASKKANLNIYRNRSTGEVYIGWKGASKVIKVEMVDSLADGRERLKSGRKALEAKLEKLKRTPSMRKEENANRVGKVRAEADVTPDLFAETFGFRGVEFGNWVNQAKRQKDLNEAYEALLDLADVLGVPPAALSLNGELALAFGARGKGGARPAAAHYEPGKVAINLTKNEGAGSLAHEWFHALDNYLSRERGLPADYVSNRPYTVANDPSRKEMVTAFKGVMASIKASGMAGRASELDGRRSKRYWSTSPELSARAFESYVIAKLGERNWSNDYLANVVSEDAWNALDEGTFPYPTKDEQGPINDAFDKFFDTLETKETNRGVKFFSKSNVLDTKPSRGMSPTAIEKAADKLLAKLSGAAGIKVKVFATQQQAERAWKMSLDGTLVKGAFDENTNTAYIVAENVTSLDEARRTLAHEVIAHGGLQNVIGKAEYQEFLNRLKSTRSKKTFEQHWREIDRDYDGMNDDVKAEELFAKFVENQPDYGALRHWFNSIRNWLRKILSSVGVVKSDADIDAMNSMMHSIVDGFKASRNESNQANLGMVFNRSEVDRSEADQYRADLARTMRSLRSNPQPIKVGRTPDVMVRFGAPELDLFITKSTIQKATNKVKENHDVPMSVIEQLPELLADPIAVLDDSGKAPAQVLIVDGMTEGGRPVTVAIHLSARVGRRMEVNRIASAYGKDNFKRMNLQYLNESKNPALVRHIRPQLPEGGSPLRGSAQNVLSKDDLVKENPKIRFSKTQDTRTAEEKIGQKIVDDTVSSKIKNAISALKTKTFWNRMREGLFDGLHGIQEAEVAAGITDPNKQGYVSARLASGIGDMLHALFNRGALEWRNGVVSTKEGTIGLMEAFGMLPEGKLNDWLAWMAGNRAEQLAKRGKENNLTPDDIAKLKAKAKGHETVFEQVRQEYNKINKATLELAREAGLLNAEQIAAFDTEWYVPFFRETDSSELSGVMKSLTALHTKRNGIVGQSAQIKELLGGKQSTKDLLTNIIQRQVSLIDAAIKNNAAREVAANLDGTNFMTKASDAEASGEFTRQELASRQKVRIMEHGKPVHYLVHDAGLLRGLMQVHDIGSKAIFNRMARSAKRFLTTGVTLSPDFIIRNFIRDAAHAWMVNKDGAKLGTDTWTGLKSSWKQGDDYWSLIAGGAAFQGGYIHGADPEAAQQQIRRQLREKGFSKSEIDNHMSTLVTTKDGLLKAFEKYRQISDRLENSNRMTVYNRAKAAGKSERQALFEAKDLMDYSMKGNFQLMSTFIDMLPFFNARLQGLYKLGRASLANGDDQLFKALSRDLAFKGLKVAGFSLALAALNGDDERYKELPEWDKDAHWHFFLGDEHFRLPKPFELGIIFGTMPERMFNFAAGNQTAKDARESVGHAVWNTLALNPTPQLLMPVAELMMNRSMFTGAPIESLADQRREAVDRYGEQTSDTARLIGQITGLVGLSPKQVEHLITGYAGTLGAYTLGVSDVLARLMTGREKASTPISDFPVVRTIYQGGKVQRNTMYQQRFIESLNAAREAYGSYQLALDEHDRDRAQKLYESRANELASRRQLERVQRQVSDLNSRMRMIQRDPSLSRSEKRERLNELQLRRNQIYQNAYLGMNLREW